MRSLASAIRHLKYQASPFVKFTTPQEIIFLQESHEHTGLPIYKVVEVYFTQEDRLEGKHFYMIFVDNGIIYYHHGDVLETLILDEHHFSTDPDVYAYEEILSAFFLDSSNELASFAGFFFLP